MIDKSTTISPSQSSHGGTLFYVYEIPKDDYHYKPFKSLISTDSGWDNPFRPDGDLSREADEIVNLIKGGKPITPTGDFNHLVNGTHDLHQESNGTTTTVADGATKLETSPLLAQQQQPQQQQNGTKSPKKETSNGEETKDQLVEPKVSSQTVPGPQSATQVVIDEKKKKRGKCCVIQ